MRLIIVEDEEDVARSLSRALNKIGYCVDIATDGSHALELVAVNEYDLMVLDLNLPDLDGLEVCRRTREHQSGLLILILTARDQIKDVVTGLDTGADDYLTKPFHLQEIFARIRALLRRDMRCREPLLSLRDICLDPAERVVWKASHRLELTRKEFDILEYLMRRPGEVISQENILEHVWGSKVDPFSNTIRVHIQSLRRKLEEGASIPYIETVIGEGYRFLLSDTKSYLA